MWKEIERKVQNKEKLSLKEAVFLLTEADLHILGELAHAIRTEKNSDKVYIVKNRHVNPTNICFYHCTFCSFRRDAGEKGAYLLKPEEIISKLKSENIRGLAEIHIVGGMPPTDLADYDYYKDIVRELKLAFPSTCIKAFTAVEYQWFHDITGKSYEEILSEFKEMGLEMLPGGGAEIFNWDVRRRICPEKCKGEEWLEIHRTAHRLGIKSNATMLYGHIEEPIHKAEHLLSLYELQEETNGFLAFIPLAYHPENNRLKVEFFTTGTSDLRHISASRIILHNFPHVKAYWIEFGLNLSQVMLSYGADDLDGTILEEHIYHDAGAPTPQGVSIEYLSSLIREAGFSPVLRDALYNEIIIEPTPVGTIKS